VSDKQGAGGVTVACLVEAQGVAVQIRPCPLERPCRSAVEIAALSRRRTRVQIPSGTLKNASAGHWRAQVAVTHPGQPCAGSTPARCTAWPVRLSVQDDSLSRCKGGFDSRTGHCRRLKPATTWPGGGIWKTRRSQKPVPERAWEFKSPPGHFSCRRAGRSAGPHKAGVPVRSRGLQLLDRVRKLAKRSARGADACGFDSHPGHCTRKVAGYGWPGHSGTVDPRKGMRVRIPCLPLLP
jgi:hypothetical protein